MSKKPVIVFEGIEGSGKTYHLSNVCKYLKKKRIPYLKIREPGGTINSEKIRKLILDKKSDFNKNTDLLLYLAARSENISKLKRYYKKKIIIIDRFKDSTIAYQHYGMDISKSLIENLNKIILNGIKPQIVFLNIVNMQNLSKRLNSRKNKNRYDFFKAKFYKKVQNGFLKISKNKSNYVIIDSNKNLVENKKVVLNKILKLI